MNSTRLPGASAPAFRVRLLITAALVLPAAPALAQQATPLPTLEIDSAAEAASAPGAQVVDAATLRADAARTSDTAEILARLPGVSAYGAGGVSSLPVLHGLDNQRIAILVDGLAIDDACPNNMNPPLSYTDPQTIASVSVLAGVSPVSMGGDTIGGVIAVETAPPRFAQSGATLVTGRASAYYRSNGDAFGGALAVTAASERLSLTYQGSYGESGNFTGGGKDGVVRSTEYAKTDHRLAVAAQTGIGLFQLAGGLQRAPYEGFPNQYMDMTDNRSWFVSGRYQGVFGWGDVDLSAQIRDTDHEMNFLADKGGTANGGMPMFTEDHGASATLKVSLPLTARDTLRLGGEFRRQGLNDVWPAVPGSMMIGPQTFVNLNHARRDRLGGYVEWQADWSDRLTTTLGVRNDQVWMRTGDVQPYGTSMMQQADARAAQAFNAADRDRHDSSWGGSASVTWRASDRAALELGYAHKVRAPNLYERYAWGRGSMASRMTGWFGDGNGYVGNLALAPERADSLSAALTLTGTGEAPWSLRIAPYLTHVADYIDVVKLADLTNRTGQPTGFVQLQFANREARLYGVDLSGSLPLWSDGQGSKLHLGLSASWQQGQNLSDDDPLYHQMPLQAQLGLHGERKGWDGRIELTAVADKTRVDPTRHEMRTDGYALLDLGAGYGWKGYRLGVEVTNLFDAAYVPPLGGVSLGDLKATGVLRPVPGRGRSLNVQFSKSF